MIDVVHQISSVDRRLDSRTLEAGEARILTVSRLYETPPEDLWDAGIEGETVLRLYVTESGAVDSVRVEKGSGHLAFDSSAVLGARDLRFEPATREHARVWTRPRLALPRAPYLPRHLDFSQCAGLASPDEE